MRNSKSCQAGSAISVLLRINMNMLSVRLALRVDEREYKRKEENEEK